MLAATREVFEIVGAYKAPWELAGELEAVLERHGVENAAGYGTALEATMIAVLDGREIERATDAAEWPAEAATILARVQDEIQGLMREAARRGDEDALWWQYWAWALVALAYNMVAWPVRSSAWLAAAMEVYAVRFSRGIRNEARLLPLIRGGEQE